MKVSTKSEYRKRRHMRLRQKVAGTAERPRMSVFVSNRKMYVQFIDDDAGATVASVSTTGSRCDSEAAAKLGAEAAAAAKGAGIGRVTFDRGGFPYRGRIKVLADAARENGLEF